MVPERSSTGAPKRLQLPYHLPPRRWDEAVPERLAAKLQANSRGRTPAAFVAKAACCLVSESRDENAVLPAIATWLYPIWRPARYDRL